MSVAASNLWGIPLEIRESVVLEVGDHVCDGGHQYEITEVMGEGPRGRAFARHVDYYLMRYPRVFKRELALDGRLFVMRGPRVRPTAIVGTITLAELRKVSGGR